MKSILATLALLTAVFTIQAQCTDCNSVEEALKDRLKVRHLDLSNQGLQQLPDSLYLFKNLESIDLSENQLTVLDLKGAPLERVYSLKLKGNIGLDANEFDKIATAFPNLLSLDLSACRIAYLTSKIGALNQLIQLDLSNNSLHFLPDELASLPQLNELNISNNSIENITYVLSNCWNLHTLHAAYNPFNPDDLLISLGFASNLDKLSLSYDLYDGKGGSALDQIAIRSIEIIGINDAVLPNSLIRNITVSELKLTNCTFPSDISPALKSMSSLSNLILDNTSYPTKLSVVDQLVYLELANIPFPSNSTLSKLDFLKELNLTQLDVSDSILSKLPALLPRTIVRTGNFSFSPEMLSNEVPVILAESGEEMTIPGDVPVQIVLDGIQLDVPTAAFLNQDGSSYAGPVIVKVTNYDNAIANAMSGVPMIYQQNGQSEVFASAGMIDFQATTDKGDTLKANADSQIQVTIVNQLPGSNSNLYNFNPVTKQWELSPNSPFIVSNDSLRKALIDSINGLELASFVQFQKIPTLFGLKIRERKWDPALLEFTAYLHPHGFNSKGNGIIIQHQENLNARYLAEYQWRIDTIITPQLIEKLMEIQCAYRIGKRVKSNRKYNNMPRLIQDLQVTPDFENDNYRMTFKYKDTLMSIPVFLNSKKTKGKSIMKEHAAFQKGYNKALLKNQKLERADSLERDNMIALFAPKIREEAINRINMLSANERLNANRNLNGNMNSGAIGSANSIANGTSNLNPAAYDNGMKIAGTLSTMNTNNENQGVEKLRFGLTSFGLVNCDFFYRNPPDLLSGLSDTLMDQNGKGLASPDYVRAILPNSNVYLSAPREQIPQYRMEKTLLLIIISATEIGLIKLENLIQGKIQSFKRLNIEGKSPDEVNKMISETE